MTYKAALIAVGLAWLYLAADGSNAHRRCSVAHSAEVCAQVMQ